MSKLFTANTYIPTRVYFGVGVFEDLRAIELPGKKALICAGPLVKKLGIIKRTESLLSQNGVESVVYDRITPNPLRSSVMEAAGLAQDSGCDFVIGLGGGSNIDAAKAVAIVLAGGGDLWNYAQVGSGGKKYVEAALPVVAISTTAGTGTETDPYCVITNEETREKLDFAVDAIFPAISIIDPELTLTLSKEQTVFQGFDALFHAAECFITNENENRLVNLYAKEAIRTVKRWLPLAAQDGNNLEARCNMAYAANILSGYTQALTSCTSHHIIAQTMGGLYQQFPHGAALLAIAEQYYLKLRRLRPGLLDQLGTFMGVAHDSAKPGQGFVTALVNLMEETKVRGLAMSKYGARLEDAGKIAEITVDVVGIDFEKYRLTKQDVQEIVESSFC